LSRIAGLYVGGITVLEPEGQSTGIFKLAVHTPLQLTREGFSGDVQADRRAHGGPEKAVHHYAAENYAPLAAAFPAAASALVPGSLGENISSSGWNETGVCIGDIFRLGRAVVQVSQPRSPCWKINHKFGTLGMSRFIAEQGITGWYYRVVEEGKVAPDDIFELLERPSPGVPLARLWHASLAHRPSMDELTQLIATAGLNPVWIEKLTERRDWLMENSSPPITGTDPQ